MSGAITIKNYRQGMWGDWQYLIILDACRYDVFAEVCRERGLGEPLKVDTRCHCTSWWYRKYWSRQDTSVHLISANPAPFHPSVGWNAWRRFKSAIWADPAGRAVKARQNLAAIFEHIEEDGDSLFDPIHALRVFEEVKQPGKRYLIHLMPPHLPFLGLKGLALFEHLGLDVNGDRTIYKAIQDYGRAGNWDEVRACYKENIEYALDAVWDFQHSFKDGKTVVTSDHAELIGDPAPWDGKGLYRHARWVKFPRLWMTLRTVPWLEVEW